MKIVKFLVRPVFLVVLAFSVTACVFWPGGPHGHGHGHVHGGAAGHR